jgi:hypothetical protein
MYPEVGCAHSHTHKRRETLPRFALDQSKKNEYSLNTTRATTTQRVYLPAKLLFFGKQREKNNRQKS